MQELAEMPLYESVSLTEEYTESIKSYLEFWDMIEDDSIDLYCIHCKEHSIFKPSNKGQLPTGHQVSWSFFNKELPYAGFHFTCTRDYAHIFEMQFIYNDESILKIGQYPSKADIDAPSWDKYSKIIPSRYLSDIKRAVGLSAHGIGAGSFVYLRRVMEYLINNAYQKALCNADIEKDKYQKSRIVEKIVLLKNYLPDILVQNKEAYLILSKGVHELEEDECIKNFNLLSTTIELILDEILSEQNRIEREQKIKAGISKLHAELKTK